MNLPEHVLVLFNLDDCIITIDLTSGQKDWYLVVQHEKTCDLWDTCKVGRIYQATTLEDAIQIALDNFNVRPNVNSCGAHK